MPSIPDSFENINSAADMLHAFSHLVGGRIAARFAIFPITEITIDTVHLQRFGWKAEISERVPFFARVTHDDFAVDLSGAKDISESPVMFLSVVSNCAVLCSLAKSQLFRRMSQVFLHNHYPYLGRAFWDTRSMFSIMQSIAGSQLCSNFRVSGISYRSLINQGDHNSRIESQRHWTDRPIDDVIRELVDAKAWASSIDFYFTWKTLWEGEQQADVNVMGSISRSSIVTARSCVPYIWETIVLPAAERSSRQRKVFANRDRGPAFDRPPKPLAIKYDSLLFEDRSNNRVLVERLRSLPESSISVYHGNPYLHAGVVDQLDGSSFEIWVVDPDQILIVPGARSSTSALERLSSHIMENFMEGEIVDCD